MDAIPNTSSPPTRLAELAARRFPLVARSQVISRPLPTRITQIQTRAEQAARGGPDALLRAAEALNLAALLVSDCGVPDLAQTLCWQQFELFHTARPFPSAIAKLALQPLINLARPHLNGRPIDFSVFISSTEDHHEISKWLWEVLLADGMRALARAGHWTQALTHAEQLRGIGPRLWDGRQIAVLARCFDGRPAEALALLQDSDLSEPWEKTVSACLTILCLHTDGRTAGDATQQMITGDSTLITFNVRLGLTIVDLLDGKRDQTAASILQHLVRIATAPGGGYAAKDILDHATSAARLATRQRADLTEIARAAGLGLGTIPKDLHSRLLDSVRTSEAAASYELTSGREATRPTP